MSPPRCYGIRLVNPFQGTLQIVHTGDARALSRDGYHWEIQVLVEQRAAIGWGSLNRQSAIWLIPRPRHDDTPEARDSGKYMGSAIRHRLEAYTPEQLRYNIGAGRFVKRKAILATW
jgi:hypothetical protein